ncbi:MAG: hypothetical protein UR69_C0002G0197 [Candidatus Moranbacteria bacterium GW2011_GWE2_35_2-]|nr:MAG: hypothetical protein UR69_C0002G0197 [Candidatus Moranbacteria bacterium GW2011_GWE2_35_2-]KKQ22454.1 MAG: hypothetical protein US37_C0002G0079 [Candidatus Moranbacteria bacterium GW2011_GWF2_37_11]KKQ29523.1 MAG: hypothetical protein US44_C0001G0115 [Candidatus Moranbacteria bacterium GW2011_GWD1_37_17]KKQ30607.1 MAG: hypothetical protein US47_C0002G0197 [Candidatus Moranbacteria bacterium GW2011_GWE1_37_24]KKQ48169.1 MAG: hypothetical protein US66_C0001G0033 [Candidatus Moranbacteria 
MSHFKKYIVILLAAFFITGTVFLFAAKNNPPLPPEIIHTPISDTTTSAEKENPQTNEPTKVPKAQPTEKNPAELPQEINLKIPFTSQAPHQNWDMPYQEFCEEASMLMAASYAKGQKISSPEDADKKLKALQKFEMDRFGFYQDTTAEETAIILREYFNLRNTTVVYNPSAMDIKSALTKNKAIILPFAGQQLGNPNFRQPGPLYHMLVIKGYTKNGDFITNDPGTKKGADYIYKQDIIMNAIHDWNNGDVDTGKKVMIVID